MRTITGTPTNAKLDSFINKKGTMKTTRYQISAINPTTGEEELLIKSSKNPSPIAIYIYRGGVAGWGSVTSRPDLVEKSQAVKIAKKSGLKYESVPTIIKEV